MVVVIQRVLRWQSAMMLAQVRMVRMQGNLRLRLRLGLLAGMMGDLQRGPKRRRTAVDLQVQLLQRR